MATYLEQLQQELASRIGSAPQKPIGLDDQTSYSLGYRNNASANYASAMAAYQDRAKNTLPTLQSQVPAGGMPARIQFASQDQNGNVGFNAQGYSKAMFDWMKANPNYKDWQDADIQSFIGSTMNSSDKEQAATLWWDQQNHAWTKAGQDAAKDRNTMLSELQAFKAGVGEGYVTQNLTREKGYWDAKIQQTLTGVQQQYAAMGRAASPYLLGEIGRRMTAQAADALQVRRAELEKEVQDQQGKYLSMLNDVLGQTNRNLIDPATAAGILKELGSGASAVRATG